MLLLHLAAGLIYDRLMGWAMRVFKIPLSQNVLAGHGICNINVKGNVFSRFWKVAVFEQKKFRTTLPIKEVNRRTRD
jgi:hypothetical protein